MTAYWIWCALMVGFSIHNIIDNSVLSDTILGVCAVLGLFLASCLLDEILNAADE